MLHIPILRGGSPYKSLSKKTLHHFLTGNPIAEVSQANPGLIARDLMGAAERQSGLESMGSKDLIERCRQAADIFLKETLAIGDEAQRPQDFLEQLSATTGVPIALCRANMEKVGTAMARMEDILKGLAQGRPLEGLGTHFRRESPVLGAILPNNSPGVHSLWLPAIALATTLALKPGHMEPWTPYRIAQAMVGAGVPKETFGFYPAGRDGAREILLRSPRTLLYGDAQTVAPWRQERGIQIHGPGFSKILIGHDQVDRWEDFLDLAVHSVAANGGRSCINASGIWVPARGKPLALQLARRLAAMEPLPLDDPQAVLSAFPTPQAAQGISDLIDSRLHDGDAEDISAQVRNPERVVTTEFGTFLRPTVIFTKNPQHSLAQTELLFPFVTVVETPCIDDLHLMGATLVLTVISEQESLRRKILAHPHFDRINFGAIATNRIRWDQPHEGNLFEFLFRGRAFQVAG